MFVEKILYFPILLFIYLLCCSSRFAISQPLQDYNFTLSNSTAGLAGLSSFWINRPSLFVNSTDDFFSLVTPILQRRNAGSQFLCGFYCNYNVTECLLGILLYHINYNEENHVINKPQLVWSANRNHPVKFNATLQLGHDGNLVLTDSDGTLVWSTDTIGKSVSGLNLTEMGNLVLFDKRKRTIWQSFDHPTDSLLPGQTLVSGRKLIASVSATNRSQGLFSLTVLYSRWTAYTDTDPPQYYYHSHYDDSPYYSFDRQTFTALHNPTNSTTQFMKIGPDGHLKVYQWSVIYWNEVSDILSPDVENCGYPMVCGSYSICTNNGQCTCPPQENFFRPFSERKPDLGCSQLTSIYCNSLQYHSFIELKNTTYFSFNIDQELNSSKLWLGQKKLEDCKRACLSNCSCKAAVFEYNWNGARRGNCLLLNEVFSLTDSEEGTGKTVFLKVQHTSEAQTQSLIIPGGKKSRPFKVIIGSTLAAFFGIILSIATCFVIFRKRARESRKAADILDLAPILPGILTRFSYNDLKITTDDFSRKLGEGGFGCVYEGTLRNGTKIAVKNLDGVGQVKESFLTEVKAVGGIHHINLVKLIGFCAEKSHRLLIYEYMVNGSLDRWITHENQENGLTWNTRQRIISDIAKGLAYLHEDCSHKIIHLDIKPQNILLDQYLNAKISDFGLSKLIEKDKRKVVTRMRGTRGYLAPEWLSSVITEKVDVYAFGIVLLEILCGRKNLDWSQPDEEDVHLLSVFRRKAEQEQLMDMVDKNEDMQLHREAVTEMMSLAAWCLQGDFSKRPSMSLVVKALEGLVTVETNLNYDFTHVPEVGAGNQEREAISSSKFPSILSGPRFAFSQHWWKLNASLLNSTSGISTSWINRPVFIANSTANFYAVTPILLSGTTGPRYHICGFYCNYSATECVLGILLVIFQHSSTGENIDYIYEPQLVWSANRNHPVNVNATLQLGQDGNLVLTDSDGTLVWSSNTTGKSVSGLNLTETGNLVLFDKANRAIWQSFDHPTDCLLPGQNLVSGQKLIASVSASNWSEGLFTLTIRNGSWATYIDSDPPQFYYSSPYSDNRYFSFDGKTFTALKHPPRPAPQFIKLGADGHLRVYQQGNFFQWTEVSDILTPDFGNCGYPMVCGRYSICSNDGQCSCPVEGNFFRPFNDRRPHLGCTALMSISCNSSQYHSLVELKYTTYFAIDFSVYQLSSRLWSEAKKLEDCKRACLSNCSCKAIVWAQTQMKNCLFLNEVFSLIDKEERVYNNMTIFLKVHNSSNEQINHSPNISPGQKSMPYKVITGYTLAAFFGIILSIISCFIIVKKRRYESSKGGDFLDLEPLLPGILTRFSYNELKIITEDFSRKLGEGGFGSVYEGTLSDGTKIAVKHLDGLGQVKDSFLTEVKILGSIHHVNLVKLIGFCGEKSESFLIYEYMINGSLDRWISPENEENGLKWHTRKRIISDIAKGLAYLHEDCSHKIIHLDIKPQNILLDQYFNAKISDFGLSKLIEKDISKVVTRMRGTPGYLAPEWLSSVITEKVDVYAFGIVLLEILCGRKNLDWSQADEEDVHLLSVFRRKAEQDQLMDMVDKNNEDMQVHREEVTEIMSIAAWCLQGDFAKRPSMSLVVKVLEGLVTVETNLDYNFKNVAKVEAGNKQREATFSSKFPSILSGPR